MSHRQETGSITSFPYILNADEEAENCQKSGCAFLDLQNSFRRSGGETAPIRQNPR